MQKKNTLSLSLLAFAVLALGSGLEASPQKLAGLLDSQGIAPRSFDGVPTSAKIQVEKKIQALLMDLRVPLTRPISWDGIDSSESLAAGVYQALPLFYRSRLDQVLQSQAPAAPSIEEAVTMKAPTQEARTESPRTQATLAIAENTYTIGPRDILAVTIFTQDRDAEEDPTIEVAVNTAGFISLPLIGKVKAAGRDTASLESEISKRLSRYVKDPQISVVVADYRARRVFVVGQVATNGPIYLERDHSHLFEIISRAGGFRISEANPLEGADPRNVIIQRGNQKLRVDFYGEATQLDNATTFQVQDGDQIFVPKPINRVRVLGGVQAAGEFELKPGMTLMDAIAKAGSFTDKSRRDQVRILRNREGRTETQQVDAVRIFRGKMSDVTLQSGDVIYVNEW